MKIVIIPNGKKDKDFKITQRVIDEIQSHGADIYMDAALPFAAENISRYDNFPCDADVIVVIGGDGSILDASNYAIRYGVPILGINLGRVGYMSALEKDRIKCLAGLFDGSYTVEEKMLLSVSIDGASAVERLAVNEVVFSHSNPVELTDLTLTDGYGETVKYRADGLILATPIGSTAYSLSAGGPIILQDHPSILVTPICPHSFFGRSMVFSDRERLAVACGSGASLNISVDGRPWGVLKAGSSCYVQRSKRNLKMITFEKEKRTSALFSKLRSLDEI